jgi:hypothetical protein
VIELIPPFVDIPFADITELEPQRSDASFGRCGATRPGGVPVIGATNAERGLP